ncbi:MAG: hypothetical protein ACI9KE_000031 [Polyangiales bacterium]
MDSISIFRAWASALLVLSLGSPALGQVEEPGDEPVLTDPELVQESTDENVDENVNDVDDDDVVQEAAPDASVSVESAEYLSQSVAGTVSVSNEGELGRAEASPPERGARRRLIFVADGRESLLHMLELQLPDWQVRQISVRPTYLRVWRAQAQLMPDDVVVWIEHSEDVERVALLDGAGDTPRSSTLPAAGGPEWARAFALVVEGLIREQTTANREAAADPIADELCPVDASLIDLRIYQRGVVRARRNRPRPWWPSPVARDGWMFRFGWTHGFAPRRRDWLRSGSSQYIQPSGGLRITAGRWLHSSLRVSAIGEFAWADREPEGVLGLQAMLVTSTRLRLGVGFELAALMVSENDRATGNRFGWIGHRIGLPFEIGLEVNGKGGLFVNVGPSWTKAPYAGRHHLGYQMSLEWEFD